MPADEHGQTGANHVAENMRAERHRAETIFQDAGAQRGPEAETDAGIKVKENDQKQHEVRVAPAAEKAETAVFEQLGQVTQDGNDQDLAHGLFN